MHDSRNNEDMPVKGWLLNVNNLAYREALGGAASYDAYRVDVRAFWEHGGGHVEERLSFTARWGATLFGGAAGLYGDAPVPLDRSIYPTFGAGVHFVLKPVQRMIVNFEYAQGIKDNRGVYLKLGYAW